MDLVRQHLLANAARILHDDLGPSLSGLALQFSVFDGSPVDRAAIRDGLDHAVELVRTMQYMAHGGLAARFGLRRAFEILPYCAPPEARKFVSVKISGLPPLSGDEAQRCFEEAAEAVANAMRDLPAHPIEVRLAISGWTLHRKEAA